MLSSRIAVIAAFAFFAVIYAGYPSTASVATPATKPAVIPVTPSPVDAGLAHSLSEFGPTDSTPKAQETYAHAVGELRKTGGILIVPAAVWKNIKEVPLQGLDRTPAAPAETKNWRTGKGVTVVVEEEAHTTVQLPPLSGLVLNRDFRLAEGDSSGHWGTHPMVELDSKLTYGTVSYLDWIQEPTPKGPDAKFYVATVRGLAPGMFLNLHGGPGYGGGVTRGCIKTIGYDPEKKLHYFTADTKIDHVAGAIVQNKTNAGILHMTQTSNCDNQTYDVKVIRNQYAHGDTYIYYCDFNYMSNVHSAAGDENGTCYGAFIRSLDGSFRGTVESFDSEKSELKFKAIGGVNTLGDSRPLINLNPAKTIASGNVMIIPASCYNDVVDNGDCKFNGQSYPSRQIVNSRTGVKELRMGGLIHGDRDCPWTPEVVGRFFAVNTPEEKTPKGSLRWYEITSLTTNADGTKDIEIKRYWWGAKSAGSPTLYRRDSYSTDGHVHPLAYIIAPGTYVNDVSRAIPGGERGGQQILGLAPSSDHGTDKDFAPGDPVEQAIGPDPFKPIAFRSWIWDDVPGAFPAPVIDLANMGADSRYAAMDVHGGGRSMEEVVLKKEAKPAWDNIIMINSAATVGINCKADFANAAILFNQPNREQPIKWHYGQLEGAPPKEATLTVSRDTGEFNLKGNGIRTGGGGVAEVRGLSGDKTQARNLRGKNIVIEEKTTTWHVKFANPEENEDYAVFVEQTWLSNRAVSEKTAEGFTVTFATPAPAGGKLDWMIVR